MKKVKTKRGRDIDFGQLMRSNDTVPAVGNASMNARGDIIDSQGKIIKTAKQVSEEYYSRSPNSVKDVSIKPDADEAEIKTKVEETKAEEKTEEKPAPRSRSKSKPKADSGDEAPDEIVGE